MFTMLSLISSLNMGLFSLLSFISLIKALVKAFTSKVSPPSSSKYSTAATIGTEAERVLRILKRAIVETKTLIPQ